MLARFKSALGLCNRASPDWLRPVRGTQAQSAEVSSVDWSDNTSIQNTLYSITMAVACLISYWIMTRVLNTVVAKDNDLLGGMWAAVAAAFVFRDAGRASLAAGVARLIATCVSFALCLAYLWVAPPSALGMALLVAVGTYILVLFDRRGEIITTAITTIVVMVVAILDPADALKQPLLRLIDTLVGIAVGVACNAAATFVLRRAERRP
jgi:uncharacterized membrane protein YccC